MNYSEKLKDPRWQKIRLRVFERDDWMCQYCCDNENTLNVHHLFYVPNRDPWNYELCALLTLCDKCHEKEKEFRPEAEGLLLEALKLYGFSADDVMVIAEGFNVLTPRCPPPLACETIKFAFENNEMWGFIEEMHVEFQKKGLKL